MPNVWVVPAPTSTAVSQAWGRQLAEHRRGLGLTQTQLAQRVGLDPQTISRLERGQGNFATLIDVAAAIDLVLVEVSS